MISNAVTQSFGRLDASRRVSASFADAVRDLQRGNVAGTSWLARGNGKSYGDSAQNAGGVLVRAAEHSAITGFDPDTGLLTADPGVSLGAIILAAGPHGWFLPVTPGTKHVSLAGAIANDVHGKNHHRRGTFGCHVVWLDLLRSDGQLKRCSLGENPELFRATIGGFGLTGLIVSATVQLLRVSAIDVVERVKSFGSVQEYLELSEAADANNEYCVAWLDQLSRAGRGLLLAANHAEAGMFQPHVERPQVSVPFQPPLVCLNHTSIKVFNWLYSTMKGRDGQGQSTAYDGYFYPLDKVGNWNYLYGPRGLYQHQSLVPLDTAADVLPELLSVSRKSGQASFLTVLKRFGDMASPSLTPFARPGYTLTLDFPNRGGETLKLLQELDHITISAGGAVNAYKDARMSPYTFAASYPGWRLLEQQRDPAFTSDFWNRTALRLG